MSFPRRQFWLLVVAVLILLPAYTWAFHRVYASSTPGANDFFSRWAGARLYFTQGWDPYSDETSLWIQEAIWGHPARPGEDPSLFAYPFYTIFLIAPYALLPTYTWAQAAWQVTLQVVMLVTFTLILAYHRWRPGPLMLGMLALWTFFFYPTARSLILGQLGLLVFLLTILALWILVRMEQPCPACDVWTGILLALTMIKPQMQFLILPFILLWALRERRWLVVIAFCAAMALLVLPSFILSPGWVGKWLAQVNRYPTYTPPAVLYILTREIVPLGSAAPCVERGLDAALLLYLFYEWWRVLWRRETWRFDWSIGLTFVITHLVAPRTATTHFVIFIFPLFALFRDVAHRKPWGLWVVLALMAVLLVGMWWLFLATLEGSQEANLVHVPLPLLMLMLVLLTRPRSDPRLSQELAT